MNENRLSIALFEPRIPQNTGNIARTCAAYKLSLHLIEPLGFCIDDKHLKRAGLDYWNLVQVYNYSNFEDFYSQSGINRLIAFSKSAKKSILQFNFLPGDCLLFGREDIGLPKPIINQIEYSCTIPMPCIAKEPGDIGVRSLNLSVAAGIAAFYSSSCLGYIE